MPQQQRVPELVGIAEIGLLAGGVPSSHVSLWRRRLEDFPEPVQVLAMGPVFLAADARAFLARHPDLGGPPTRIAPDVRLAVRAAVSAGQTNVAALSRQYGITRNSVYAIVSDLLFTVFTEPDPGSEPQTRQP
jgi:hypothetical protein